MPEHVPKPRVTTAARLLRELAKESASLHDSTVIVARIAKERAIAAAEGTVQLTLDEQLRLADAAARCERHRRLALRLRSQVMAARSYEDGEVDRHAPPSAERWERRGRL